MDTDTNARGEGGNGTTCWSCPRCSGGPRGLDTDDDVIVPESLSLGRLLR